VPINRDGISIGRFIGCHSDIEAAISRNWCLSSKLLYIRYLEHYGFDQPPSNGKDAVTMKQDSLRMSAFATPRHDSALPLRDLKDQNADYTTGFLLKSV
jgi:hypothetical protein